LDGIVSSGFLRELQDLIGDAYEIERELGGGGMSHVFLATERSLGRRVVIKVLPPELVSGVSEARFKREILVTANLQHPNILPILAAGAREDIHYFVTPYVEGQTLRDRLAFQGAMPITDGVQLLSEISSALGHAHSRGIVHRDIKPENILLSDGHAVLADFGIAAACHRCSPSTQLTLPGQSPGTPGYMAPEQLVDPTGTDPRMDVFALGVVAYEMFTGKKPFSGISPNAFFLGEAPSLTTTEPRVPRAVGAAVSRALSPDPAKRFADAGEFHTAIRAALTDERPAYGRRHWLTKAAGAVLGAALLGGYLVLSGRLSSGEPNESASDRRMLAVLPFKNLGKAEDAYFAEGVTEEVTSRLAMLSGLGVISRTSADQYANTTKSLKEIARELGADYVLEGSVRLDRSARGAGRVRVTPQLIRVRDDTHLWSFPYEGEIKDVFTVQTQIAEKVAGALVATLPGAERQQMSAQPTQNLAAYDAYLQGERLRSHQESDPVSLVRAEKLFSDATAADPRFALAFSKLALLHAYTYESFLDHTPERLAAARKAADSAIALDANLPDGHLALGRYYEGMDDIANASVHYAVAEKQRPNDATILVSSASVLVRSGAWNEGIKRFQRAAELDPRAPGVQVAAAHAYVMSRDYKTASKYLERAIAADSVHIDAHAMKAVVAFVVGDWPRTREIAHNLIQRFGAERLATSAGFEEIIPALDTADLKVLERVPLTAFAGSKLIYHFWRAHLFQRWQPARASAHADSMLRVGQRLIVEQPDDRTVLGASGWANGLLGNREQAISHTRRALELSRQARDAHAIAESGQHAMYTFLRIGDQDAAIDVIEQLLKVPSYLSVGLLRVDPMLAPLRSNPRIQRLLAQGT
jgi:serine/threonine-protein kinase